MSETSKKHDTPAKIVARRGIAVGSAQAPRSSKGTRFPESARKSAQKTVRAAMSKTTG